MKSAMKRAAGGVALTMVLIRGFCGGGVFLGYLGIECLITVVYLQVQGRRLQSTRLLGIVSIVSIIHIILLRVTVTGNSNSNSNR